MKSTKYSPIVLIGLTVFATPSSFAKQSVYDPNCDCWVSDTTGPDIPIDEPSEDPLPESDGRCLSGPPGLNGNPPGVGDVEFPGDTIDPCDITSEAACNNPNDHQHLVYVSENLQREGNLRNKLAVVLPGSGMNPANIKWLLKGSAYSGFRTIGLAFEGLTLGEVKEQCPGSETLNDCINYFRQETLYGGGHLDRVNSIRQRLIDLLEHLDVEDPNGGWGEYLKESGSTRDLRYAKIIISGFSLGSGHAAYWAKDEKFGGVVTLAGPTDYTSLTLLPSNDPLDTSLDSFVTVPTFASWILDSHATPGDRRAALVHIGEGQQKMQVIEKAWNAFGLSQHATKDLTYAWDVLRANRPGGQPAHEYLSWPYVSQEQRFTINTTVGPNCDAHLATAENACVNDDQNFDADVPRAFGAYMHLFCSVDD